MYTLALCPHSPSNYTQRPTLLRSLSTTEFSTVKSAQFIGQVSPLLTPSPHSMEMCHLRATRPVTRYCWNSAVTDASFKTRLRPRRSKTTSFTFSHGHSLPGLMWSVPICELMNLPKISLKSPEAAETPQYIKCVTQVCYISTKAGMNHSKQRELVSAHICIFTRLD